MTTITIITTITSLPNLTLQFQIPGFAVFYKTVFYKTPNLTLEFPYLWLVGNGGMVAIVVIIVPHSSIPY